MNLKEQGRAFAAASANKLNAFRTLAAARTVALRARFRPTWDAIVHYRPTNTGWTRIVATLTVALGAFLVIAPSRELATGREYSLQTLLTLCWLATGSSMLAAGVGIFLRMASFRRFLKIAFACSIPLPLAFVYKTMALGVTLRTAPRSARGDLETWISGGVQLSLFFLVVSGFLFFLLRFKHLNALQCSGAAMAGRAGPAIVGGIGAAAGIAAGYVIWVLCRWLGFSLGVSFFRESVRAVPVDYFALMGAFAGASVSIFATLRRRARQRGPATPTPPAPMTPGPHP